MTTMTRPRVIAGLQSDASRFSENLIEEYDNIIALQRVRRELSATLSAIVGGRRRIEMRHNTEGKWAVVIDDEVLATTIVLHWSAFTADENRPGWRRYTTRGEALCTLVHEAMHVLETSDVGWPPWVKPEHRDAFHMMLNFAEDVRIEDLGEKVVPAFRNLRHRENERLVVPNVTAWPTSPLVRQVCSVLFCEVSTQTGAAKFAPHLRNNPNIKALIDRCRAPFNFATQAADTQGVCDRLRPMYEALAPYLDGSVPPPPPPGDDEGEDEGEGEGRGEGGGEPIETENEGNEPGKGKGGTRDDESDDDNGTSGDDADSDEEDDGDGDGGDTDDDTDPDDTDPEDYKYTTPGGPDQEFRPNAPRGKWDEVRERDDENSTYETNNDVLNGDPIAYDDGFGEADCIDTTRTRVTAITARLVKHLRRVLQDNANGGWSTRKRSGVFDPRNSTRIALGDMRTFRKRRDAKGTLDYSLVLCLDASGSVGGTVGEAIADAGLAMYDAAARIPGLDVAVCAYGSSILYAIPFDQNVHDVFRDGSRNTRRLNALLSGCHHGLGGGTHEAEALTWAAAASRNRNAQAQMVVVLTDGAPSFRHEIPALIEDMRADGIRTGGIGVMHQPPSYHEYAVRVDSLEELPATLADLVRTMMKGR